MKKIWKYVILFVVFLFAMTVFYLPFRLDTYVNYGFSYGIVNGQIPYNDFNIIVPLFSPFLYSILLVFNKSILVYYIEQAILLVVFSIYLFKLLDNKAWFVIASLFCPFIFLFAYCMFPGYNFIILLELLLLIYYEEKQSDSIIGIIAGMAVITKHSVGIPIFIVAILYPLLKNKNWKSSLKRLLFGLIPILIFLIYLLCSSSLTSFIDYCLLGMDDFTNSFQYSSYYLVLIIILLILISIKFFKTKNKNISYFYLLAYLPIIYPTINSYHASLFMFFLFIVFIYNTKIHIPKRIVLYSFIIIFFFISMYDFLSRNHFSQLNLYYYHNFPVEFISPSLKKDYDSIIKFNKKHKVILIDDASKNIFITSTCNHKLNKYFILLKGNQGSGGTKILISNLKNEHDVYYVVPKEVVCHNKFCQFDIDIPEMIKKEYTLYSELNNYYIYYSE